MVFYLVSYYHEHWNVLNLFSLLCKVKSMYIFSYYFYSWDFTSEEVIIKNKNKNKNSIIFILYNHRTKDKM